jgi:hypothetical protein
VLADDITNLTGVAPRTFRQGAEHTSVTEGAAGRRDVRFSASWRSARMVVQAGQNESSVTSCASSECVLKIAGLLPGLPQLPNGGR